MRLCRLYISLRTELHDLYGPCTLHALRHFPAHWPPGLRFAVAPPAVARLVAALQEAVAGGPQGPWQSSGPRGVCPT
jgi:hypothetical protein